jgi:hypothetical protein
VGFTDLAVEAGFVMPENISHRYTLVHNGTGRVLLEQQTVSNTDLIDLPSSLLDKVGAWCRQNGKTVPGERLFYLKITSRRGAESKWGEWVRVHLLYHGPAQGFTLAGIERED